MTDIFALAFTPTQVFSASGSSAIKVYSTNNPEFPIAQTLEKAHKLGCHHLAISKDGRVAASVGFGGEVNVWTSQDGLWAEEGKIVGMTSLSSQPPTFQNLRWYG